MQSECSYNEPELSVSEVANLSGCSERYIRAQLSRGELNGEKRLNERNRPVYHIPLSSLETKLQDRYFKREASSNVRSFPVAVKPLDIYTTSMRISNADTQMPLLPIPWKKQSG